MQTNKRHKVKIAQENERQTSPLLRHQMAEAEALNVGIPPLRLTLDNNRSR